MKNAYDIIALTLIPCILVDVLLAFINFEHFYTSYGVIFHHWFSD